MASRTTFSELSSPPVSGSVFLAEYSDRIKSLFDASALPLISVGGTANAVTATLDPALDGGGLVDGMKFEITWGAANTAGVTLALNGGSAVSVLDPAGTALVAGAIGSGLRSLLEYIGGSFRILSPLLSSLGGGSARYYWQFTASGTWNKPAGLDADTMVFVEAWAGGAGGFSGAGGGGGGGGWRSGWYRLGDLPSSVSVTVGAGGAVNAAGGDSSFGSLLTIYGGQTGGSSTGGRGGSPESSGLFGGGASSTGAGNPATTEHGGGGGGAGGTAGGKAFRGGGGGAGGSSPTGGASIYGGNGGGDGVAGSAPGGGGGRNAAGARGEVRVWI